MSQTPGLAAARPPGNYSQDFRTAPADAQKEPGELVAELRECGASQGHIARSLGVSVSVVSRWQARTRTPSGRTLLALRTLHRDVTAWTERRAS